MSSYKHLLFFNKAGNPLNFKYDETVGYWTGTLYLPKIGCGLIENETVYLLENLLTPSLTGFIGTPHVDIAQINGNISISLQKAKEFFLFETEAHQNELPLVLIKNSVSATFIKGIGDTVDLATEKIITSDGSNFAIRFEIGFKSIDEDVFEDVIVIRDSTNVIAKISLYSETEGEDERFIKQLANIGELIGQSEEFIFRESDIKEDLPNYHLLNQKRKEYLIELQNLKPYYTTYFGIINLLNFFGYPDLRVKEYWLNTTTNTYSFEEINLGEVKKLDDPTNLNFYNLKKTTFFGLFYDLNKTTENFTEDELPEVVPNFQYSQEEILIKLFGLKEYFIKKDIGGIGKILDIVGEYINYNAFDVVDWRDSSKLFTLDDNIDVKFSSDKQILFIEDLRPVLTDYASCPIDPDADISDLQIGMYDNCFVGWLQSYYMTSPEFLDEPGIPIGATLKLANDSFKVTWRDCQFSWNSVQDAEVLVTWNNIKYFNFYDSEWIIKRSADIDDPRQFTYKIRKASNELFDHTLYLPYTGFYDVTLVLYGYNGNTIKLTKEKYVEVLMKEVEWMSFYKIIEPVLQTWKKNYLTWRQIKSEWKNIIYDNEPFTFAENEVKNETFDIKNYLNIESNADFHLGIDPPKWKDLAKVSWNDMKYHKWTSIDYTTEKPARIIVDKMMANGQLQVKGDIVIIPSDYNINDFARLATYLNALSVDLFPDIRQFEWAEKVIGSLRFMEGISVLPGIEGDCWLGSCGGVVARAEIERYRTWSDFIGVSWRQIGITWNNAENLSRTKALENSFSYDNIRLYKDPHEVPLMSSLFFSIDSSKIPGKTSASWKVIKPDTTETGFFENLSYVYRFDVPGNYGIEVEIKDSNGNKKILKKENYVKVYKTNRFEVFKSLDFIK